MTDDLTVNYVQSTTTHIFGRSLNSARNHHFVVDGTTEPKEELTPVEVFIAGVSSCAVHLIERFAREGNVALQRAQAGIEVGRSHEDPSKFQYVSMRMDLYGCSQDDAEMLVERFKGR